MPFRDRWQLARFFFSPKAFKWNDMGSPLKNSLLKKWVEKLGVNQNPQGWTIRPQVRRRSVSADSATSVSREAKSWASEIDTWLALQWPRLVALIGWKSSTSTKRWRTLSLWQRISTTDRAAHGYPKWRIGCCDLTVDAESL